MQRKTLLFYGGIVLIGVALTVGMVVWLRARNQPTDIVQLQVGVPSNVQKTVTQPSGKPAIRPFTPIDKQPRAKAYIPGSSVIDVTPVGEPILPDLSSTTTL